MACSAAGPVVAELRRPAALQLQAPLRRATCCSAWCTARFTGRVTRGSRVPPPWHFRAHQLRLASPRDGRDRLPPGGSRSPSVSVGAASPPSPARGARALRHCSTSKIGKFEIALLHHPPRRGGGAGETRKPRARAARRRSSARGKARATLVRTFARAELVTRRVGAALLGSHGFLAAVVVVRIDVVPRRRPRAGSERVDSPFL